MELEIELGLFSSLTLPSASKSWQEMETLLTNVYRNDQLEGQEKFQ
jgi:hypothetical protein